jgi:hypothetical protein
MELDKQIEITSVSNSAESKRDGTYAKVLIYEFYVGKLGPFREKFYTNEQHADAINRRLNEHVELLRATGALKP